MNKSWLEEFGMQFDELLSKFKLPLEDNIITFSLLLFIILLSPIILRPLKIPALIGLIIAGIAIGPKGFNVISDYNMKHGFMAMFSKFGLLYIMFMAGMELNLQEFKRYKNQSIVFGSLTFFIPLLLGYPICRYVLHLNEIASLLTASMFSTHTLVAYPIVTKYGISKLEAVAIAIGGTIITDTAVLIMLPFVTHAQDGFNVNVLIKMTFTLTIFSLVMFYIIPKVSRWFLSKLESEKASQYIYVLSVLFFAAFLAEAAGLEGIIGAFVAGLVLNRLIPHNSTLMNRVEFIGNAIFIPFFLMFVGMVVDVKLLFHGWGPWFVAIVLTTFAILSKWIAAKSTQWLYKLPRIDGQLIFGLSSAHAAATLAIIKIGADKGIMGSEIVNGTVILILITSMVASFTTDNAAKKALIKGNKNEEIEEPSLRTQHILVAANELKGNEKMLDFSTLITNHQIKNPISVVSVFDNDAEAEGNIRRSRRHLDDFISHYNTNEINVHAFSTIDTNFASGISRVSKEIAADLVIMNDTSDPNLLRRFVGDDRDRLIESCDKTLFFCHFEKTFTSYRGVTITCPPMAELEPDCNQWIERVFRITKELNCNMHVYCTRETFEKIKSYRTTQKFMADLVHHETSSSETMIDAFKQCDENQLFVMVGARNNSISAFNGMDTLSYRMAERPEIDHIFVIPARSSEVSTFTSYDDMDASPLAVGVETITKIGKDIGDLFKGKQ